MTVVYDGWALAYDPNSPAAIHLLTLLHAHPPEWKAILALPAASFHPIPQGVETRFIPCENSPLGSLRWEQRLIPILAHQCEATWIHTVGGGPPLFTSSGRLLSPAGFTPGSSAQPMQRRTLAERARVALSAGGLSQARWTLWPQDLPTGGVPGPLYPLATGSPPHHFAANKPISPLNAHNLPSSSCQRRTSSTMVPATKAPCVPCWMPGVGRRIRSGYSILCCW